MQTFFAPAERADPSLLRREIDLVRHNPLLEGLLRNAGGLLAVLNEERQILAINDSLVRLLGIDDAGEALGLRTGEVINCAHAHDMEGGCGTSRFCASCGAAIAIVACLAGEGPVERTCVLSRDHGRRTTEMCLHVRASLIPVNGRRLVALYLQDVTDAQRWAAIDRVFFHEIGALVSGLAGTCDQLRQRDDRSARDLAGRLSQIAARLAQEVAIQKSLLREEPFDYRPDLQEVSPERVLGELLDLFAYHPVAKGKTLSLPGKAPIPAIVTDAGLLSRILAGMLLNAFEATDPGGEVRLWAERSAGTVAFHVWNRRAIPASIVPRIFQRYFSTKQEAGRGQGTCAMKLIGERCLGGKVDFVSSGDDGTTFSLTLPAATLH